MQVGVEKITLNGRFRITMKPLMDEMPIVAAMQVSPSSLALFCVPLQITFITIVPIPYTVNAA